MGGQAHRHMRFHLNKWWILGGVVAVVLYVLVLVFYSRSTTAPPAPEIAPPNANSVYVLPYALTPAENVVKAKLRITPPADLVGPDGLTAQIDVHLLSADKTVTFAKGDKSPSADVIVSSVDGSLERYPFDHYTALVDMYSSTPGPDGKEKVIPSTLVIYGNFPGWRVLSDYSTNDLPAADATLTYLPDYSAGIVTAKVAVSRNGSTVSIVLLLLLAMVVLTVFALVVARAVSSRRKRIEATLAGWFAALLFAMVPLRTNMPGAPPIGQWIDFAVFLWVILGLMIALAVFMATWLADTPPPPPHHKHETAHQSPGPEQISG